MFSAENQTDFLLLNFYFYQVNRYIRDECLQAARISAHQAEEDDDDDDDDDDNDDSIDYLSSNLARLDLPRQAVVWPDLHQDPDLVHLAQWTELDVTPIAHLFTRVCDLRAQRTRHEDHMVGLRIKVCVGCCCVCGVCVCVCV